jgi:rhodanese-related sulfurtransferase
MVLDKRKEAMRRSVFGGMLVVCVALLGAVVWAEKAADQCPDISIKDLKGVIDKKTVTVIDANGSESYREGHIPGAIDFEAAGDKLQKLLPKDKDALIVAYCGGPQCMAYKAPARKATELGYTNVKHLSAGISGWKAAGEKVAKAQNVG